MIERIREWVSPRPFQAAGCGFLGGVEIEALLEDRLDGSRENVFQAHCGDGCAPCSLLAADLRVFHEVISTELLPSERQEFEQTRAATRALIRQRLEAFDEARQARSRLPWGRVAAMAAAAVLIAMVFVPQFLVGRSPGRIELPNGEVYTIQPPPYSAPPAVRGGESLSALWDRAGAAYAAGDWGRAASEFGAILDREPRTYDASRWRGLALLMDGRHDAALRELRRAAEIAEEQLGRQEAGLLFHRGLAELAAGRTRNGMESLVRSRELGGEFGNQAAEILERIDFD